MARDGTTGSSVGSRRGEADDPAHRGTSRPAGTNVVPLRRSHRRALAARIARVVDRLRREAALGAHPPRASAPPPTSLASRPHPPVPACRTARRPDDAA